MRRLTDFRRSDITRTLNGSMLRWGAARSCALSLWRLLSATLAGQVRECRIIWNPDFELPEGVYWFQGVDEGSIILQVVSGSPPGDAMVVPLGDVGDGHPLANAWGWAEELWESAVPVPAPRFGINEAAVTHPGGIDVVIRDRKFFREYWSYTVMIEGRQQDILESGLRPRPQV